MFYRLFVTLILFSGFAASDNPTPSRTLVVSSSHLLEVPPFGAYGHAQCDKDGNLFFHNSGAPFDQGAILKLKSGSWESRVFKISQDASEKVIFERFSVSPSGEMWQIGTTKKGQQVLFTFTGDGEVSSRTKLDAADNLFIQDFAVSDRGTVLVTGYFDPTAAPELQGRSYVALFDRSGHLIKHFNELFEQVDVATVGLKLHSGNAVFAEDGYFYLLHDQSIQVLSESGSMVHRIKFDKPDKEAIPTGIRISTGMAAIWLTYVDKRGTITNQFLVLDLQTQEPFALYTPGLELKDSSAVCFSRKDGFEFRKIESGRVWLIQSALR